MLLRNGGYTVTHIRRRWELCCIRFAQFGSNLERIAVSIPETLTCRSVLFHLKAVVFHFKVVAYGGNEDEALSYSGMLIVA